MSATTCYTIIIPQMARRVNYFYAFPQIFFNWRRTAELHTHSLTRICFRQARLLRSSFSRRICPTADFQRYHNGKRFHSKGIYILAHNFRKVKHFLTFFKKTLSSKIAKNLTPSPQFTIWFTVRFTHHHFFGLRHRLLARTRNRQSA